MNHQIILDDYELKKILGEGNSCIVKQGEHIVTKKQYAIKILKKNKEKYDKLIKDFDKEIMIMESLDHPNIPKLFHHSKTGKLIINNCIMESDIIYSV
jgi:serine/threonine protein kinase